MKNFETLKQALATANTLCIGDIFTDAKTKRIHIMFAEKPCETMRQALRAHGFGWYPKQGTWSKNWTAEDEKFARAFVRKCNRSGNVGNVANKTIIIDFPKSDAPKMSTAELEQMEQVKTVADTVKTTPKTVKAPKVQTVKTNVKKVNAVTERDGIKIGDIFVQCCGYSMTYYYFYKVVGFKGQKTVVMAPICKKQIDGSMGMYGNVVPVDKFRYNDPKTGLIEKIVKTGGQNPSFRGKEYLYRHVAGKTYYENHLD